MCALQIVFMIMIYYKLVFDSS